MNDRIKELAALAGLKIEIMVDESNRDVECYVDSNEQIPSVQKIEKLCQLVVKECLQQITDTYNQDGVSLNAEWALDDAAQAIKSVFQDTPKG